MNPLLLDIPEQLESQRLVLRAPRLGDGALIYPSVRESMEQLKPWMPWATDDYNEQGAEEWCRRNAAKFVTREEVPLIVLLKDGTHIGNIGAFRFDWAVPKCEIGYWLRTSHTGRGYMTEATSALTTFCFHKLGSHRVEIRCDDNNLASARVAERCQYQLEGVFHFDSRTTAGQLRHTRIYARTRPG